MFSNRANFFGWSNQNCRFGVSNTTYVLRLFYFLLLFASTITVQYTTIKILAVVIMLGWDISISFLVFFIYLCLS